MFCHFNLPHISKVHPFLSTLLLSPEPRHHHLLPGWLPWPPTCLPTSSVPLQLAHPLNNSAARAISKSCIRPCHFPAWTHWGVFLGQHHTQCRVIILHIIISHDTQHHTSSIGLRVSCSLTHRVSHLASLHVTPLATRSALLDPIRLGHTLGFTTQCQTDEPQGPHLLSHHITHLCLHIRSSW